MTRSSIPQFSCLNNQESTFLDCKKNENGPLKLWHARSSDNERKDSFFFFLKWPREFYIVGKRGSANFEAS